MARLKRSGIGKIALCRCNGTCTIRGAKGGHKCRHGLPYALHSGARLGTINADIPRVCRNSSLPKAWIIGMVTSC